MLRVSILIVSLVTILLSTGGGAKVVRIGNVRDLNVTKPGFMKGGAVLFATDDFFGRAENLLKVEEPIYIIGFTDSGKAMDGWETRRRRLPGHDWAIIALEELMVIEEFCVDTGFFTGNYALRFSIQAAQLTATAVGQFPPRYGVRGTAASEEDLKEMEALETEKWEELVPMSLLKPGRPDTRRSYFTVNSNKTWTHLRLNIYPDGGIGRLRIYGTTPSKSDVTEKREMIDLIHTKNGGVVKNYSNAHYSHPSNLIKDGRAVNMLDGWETARRLDRPAVIQISDSGKIEVPGEEWVIIKLGKVGIVDNVIIDTYLCKGNFPHSVRVEGILDLSEEFESEWVTVLPTKLLQANKEKVYTDKQIEEKGPFSHVKIVIAPDGEVTRFRLFGYPLEEEYDPAVPPLLEP